MFILKILTIFSSLGGLLFRGLLIGEVLANYILEVVTIKGEAK